MNAALSHVGRWLRPVALTLVTTSAAACAHGGLHSPVREVDGTRYMTAEGRSPFTSSWDFTKKWAWLSAASALSRARATEVYSRLTQDQRAQLERLLRGSSGRREITGPIEFIDEATARSPLRDIHELATRRDKNLLVVILGIPTEIWSQLIDEAAEETEQTLRGGGLDLEASPRIPRP
jgi:hypothetical protein